MKEAIEHGKETAAGVPRRKRRPGAFIVKSIADYPRYLESYGSAPFWVWVLVNALYLVVPAIIVFVVGVIIKKRQK